MNQTRAVWPIALVVALTLSACLSDDPESTAPDTAEPVAEQQEAIADELLTPYRSASGQFDLSYPTTWTVTETFDGGAVVLANKNEVMERYQAGAAPEEDDLVVNIGFLPVTLFEQRELRRFDVTDDLAPDDYLRAALPVFDPVDDATLGEVELVRLPDGHEAGAVIVEAPDRAGRILTLAAGLRVTAIVSVTTAPGQRHRYDEVVEAIAATITFSGDDDALYGRLLTG